MKRDQNSCFKKATLVENPLMGLPYCAKSPNYLKLLPKGFNYEMQLWINKPSCCYPLQN